ncbi:MAG: tRNA pseudouridine(55) synthase TruB [Bdellovibrionaceae bacterium]|nr:tRNA pseudouridine(55) synthase TruB [Pseudobdellovibrionaceae bacterium]MBX3033440.1 tRNA pseudouridine(55) synthase TruB [Pseudobdellovibrionaceae bacterium]
MSEPLHGLLLINKEPGGTSHDVVARVRRILGTRSVGHSGTLDPLAGGLMVLLVGEGTKLSNYILDGHKAYRAQARLGVSTDTLDITGEVLERRPVNVPFERIEQALRELEGEFEWEVPLFSAVKVQGRPLHKYARQGQGEEVARPVKKMSFWDVRARSLEPDLIEIDLQCSKGSYVRSLIHQLGEKLGCGAAMSALTRTGSVPYSLEDASTLDELGKAWSEGGELRPFIPMGRALPGLRRVRVQGQDQGLLLNGQISHDLRSMLITQVRPGVDDLVQVHSAQDQLLALIALEPGKGFAIRRVFRY